MIKVRENHTETTLFIYISKNLRTINFQLPKWQFVIGVQ